MVLRSLGWQLACWGWVASAIIGQPAWWWWTLASLGVLAVSGIAPGVRRCSAFGLLLAGCLAVYLIHARQPYGTAARWVLHAGLLLATAQALAERDGWPGVRRALVVCAWAQLPLMAWQVAGGALPWEPLGSGLTGSVQRRAVLAILLSVASLLSGGWQAAGLALASVTTGSLMGVLALLRVLPARVRLWGLLGLLGVGWPVALERLNLRVEAWQGASFLPRGWLTGWGFLPLPGGFQYDGGLGGIMARSVTSDYHSAILDWVARTGIVGLVMLFGVCWWAWRHSRTTEARWLVMLAVWVGGAQSLEQAPALIMLLLAWWIALSTEPQGDTDAVAAT